MVTVEKISYHGWPNCQKISNDLVELIVTADVGPRIIHYGFKGGENQFYENPAEAGLMGGDNWHSFGGHRLWHAPEDVVRTYVPDNQPVKVKVLKDGARFTAATESTGIQKIIEVHLSETDTKVTVKNILINHTLWSIPLAVWALTVMKAGGKVIVPHSPRIGHDDQLTPNESLVLWGYTKMNDPRWTWGEKYFFLQQDSSFNYCQKIGSLNTNGWAAYQRNTDLFIKKFDYDASCTYPDLNCNFETYTDQSILEIETLGPMIHLETGQQAQHVEEWFLHKGVKNISSDADVDRLLIPLL